MGNKSAICEYMNFIKSGNKLIYFMTFNLASSLFICIMYTIFILFFYTKGLYFTKKYQFFGKENYFFTGKLFSMRFTKIRLCLPQLINQLMEKWIRNGIYWDSSMIHLFCSFYTCINLFKAFDVVFRPSDFFLIFCDIRTTSF